MCLRAVVTKHGFCNLFNVRQGSTAHDVPVGKDALRIVTPKRLDPHGMRFGYGAVLKWAFRLGIVNLCVHLPRVPGWLWTCRSLSTSTNGALKAKNRQWCEANKHGHVFKTSNAIQNWYEFRVKEETQYLFEKWQVYSKIKRGSCKDKIEQDKKRQSQRQGEARQGKISRFSIGMVLIWV